jgi:biopolymer transport protein ExbB
MRARFRGARGFPLLEFVKAGGVFMVPIVLCSIAALAISIERWWTLDHKKIVPRETLAEVWDWIRKNELTPDRLRALRNASPLGRILAAGLANAHHGRDVMKESIEEAAGHVVHDLERYLNTLGTIAEVCPLLGLLGTVAGMIEMFTQVQQHGAGDAGLLAGGISTALVATAGGLIVAIPALILHRHFLRRVDTIVVALEQESTKLVDAVAGGRPVEIRTGTRA